ncbi:TPA: hypothetical protein TZS90_000273 [Streptococcus suis]|nr:hypothetical protein [Streptococcus suis]
MDINQITVTFLTACVPSLVTYFVTKKQMHSKIKEVEIRSANEIKRLEKETELRIKESQQNQQMEWTNKVISGELDIEKLTQTFGQLTQLQNVINQFQK